MNGRASAAITKAAKADPRVRDWDVDDYAVIIFLADGYAINSGNDVLSSLTACTVGDYREQMKDVIAVKDDGTPFKWDWTDCAPRADWH